MRTVKAAQTIISPPHKIEIDLIGAGGTGSQVMQGLARMDLALESMGHHGLHVTTYDFDTVEQPNIGRQLFSVNDLNENKAACLTSKINRFYGFSWDFVPAKYSEITGSKLIITCVDNVASRHSLHRDFCALRATTNKKNTVYWMDFGNGANQGQVVLGSTMDNEGGYLYTAGDMGLPEKDDPEEPSCSLAEALTKQDLMINPMIANAGMAMLWRMFRTLKVEYNCVYLNLEKMKMNNKLNYNNYENERLKGNPEQVEEVSR